MVSTSGEKIPVNTDSDTNYNPKSTENGQIHTRSNKKRGIDTKSRDAVPPDGGWGWVVAVSVGLGNVLNNGHLKAFGLYVAPLMHLMDATPTQVSWIASFWIGTNNCFSIIASSLAQVWSPRRVVMIGAGFVLTGFAISSFAQNLTLLYFTFGLCGGIGMSFTFTPAVQMIGYYFFRRRGIANGMCLGGNALGGILMPLIVANLLEEFGFRGTILIMGGLMLNTCVCAMMWHPVQWHQRKESPASDDAGRLEAAINSNDVGKGQVSSSVTSPLEPHLVQYKTIDALPNRIAPDTGEVSEETPKIVDIDLNDKTVPPPDVNRIASDEDTNSPALGTLENESNIEPYLSRSTFVNPVFDPDELDDQPPSYDLVADSLSRTGTSEDMEVAGIPKSDEPIGVSDSQMTSKGQKIIDLTLLREPMFWIIVWNEVCSLSAYPPTQTFLPLRVLNLGYTQRDGAMILSTLAFADLFGRLFISWLSDFTRCPRSYWYGAGMATSGIISILLPFCQTIPMLAFAAAAFGFSSGSYVGLISSRISDVFGGQRVGMAIGLIALVTCPFSFSGSPLMGFVLEKTGSYHISQGSVGVLLLIGGFVCFLEHFIRKTQKNEYSVSKES